MFSNKIICPYLRTKRLLISVNEKQNVEIGFQRKSTYTWPSIDNGNIYKKKYQIREKGKLRKQD